MLWNKEKLDYITNKYLEVILTCYQAILISGVLVGGLTAS